MRAMLVQFYSIIFWLVAILFQMAELDLWRTVAAVLGTMLFVLSVVLFILEEA